MEYKSIKTSTKFQLIIMMLFVSLQIFAKGNLDWQGLSQKQYIDNFDKQRPDGVTDNLWASLKAAMQDSKLVAADAAAGDLFGVSVSVSGDRVLIGTPYDDDAGNRSGSAYIFEYDNGTSSWDTGTKLVAADAADDDFFGWSVSVSGDRALIGAYLDDDAGSGSGSAYVFEYDNGTSSWDTGTKLVATDAAGGDQFGRSVSVSGDRTLIGAYADDDAGSGSGSAYVFEYDNGTSSWNTGTKLVAADAAAGDLFGGSVSVSGDRALIGAYGNDDAGSASGSAYIFEYDNGTSSWDTGTKLVAADAVDNDQFGISVSVSGDKALIGAYLNDDAGFNSGSAYIFEYDNSTSSWDTGTKLVATDAAASDLFGYSVSVSGDRVLIGAYADDDAGLNSGSAYIFEYDNGTSSWDTGTKLVAADAAGVDYFGYSVSISGDRVLIGANQDDDAGSDSGSAYTFYLDEFPIAIDDAFTIPEDPISNALIFPMLNDTDVDGGLMEIVAVTQPVNGTVINNTTNISYQPAANYCNDGNPTDDFTYTLNGGSQATIAMSVTCIDDLPIAVDDTIPLLKNAPLTPWFVTQNDNDPDGGLIEVISVTQPSNGIVTNNTNYISYQPNANYCNDGLPTDDFSYTLNGGSSANVSVVVSCTFSVGGQVTNLDVGNSVQLYNFDFWGNNFVTVSANGNFVFLRLLQFNSTYQVAVNLQPNNQTCVVSGGDIGDGSGVVTTTDITNISVNCNTAPTIEPDFYTIFEDSNFHANDADGNTTSNSNDNGVIANDTDPEGDVLSVVNSGTYTAAGIGGQIVIAADGTFSYSPPNDLFGRATFAFNVTDGFNITPSLLTIDVLPVNDMPTFSIVGDIDATNMVDLQNYLLQVNNFAQNISFGPANESNQQVAQFTTSIYSDWNGVLNNISVNNNGDLDLDFSLNSGVAIIHLEMQDDGGTAFNGLDTSVVIEFMVVFTDSIFSNGFDSGSNRIFEYLNSIQTLSPRNDSPYFDFDNNDLLFYGHTLKIDYENPQLLQIIQYWLDEILIKEIPYGDYDIDGQINMVDKTPFLNNGSMPFK